jgi:RNA polymerase sigma-70 factor, ECF subfamily
VTGQLREEDAADISRMFRETSADLYAYACTLPGIDRHRADDLVQEAFKAAAVAWDSLARRDREGRRRWLFKVLRNKAIDQWRKEKNATAIPDPPEPRPSGDATADRVLSATALAKCWVAVQGMPPVRQQVAFLRWGEDWTSAEIASWLSISQDTVRGHLRVARRELIAQVGADVPFISDPEIDEGG